MSTRRKEMKLTSGRIQTYEDSFDDGEGNTILAFNKSTLFPMVSHTCLMAKES